MELLVVAAIMGFLGYRWGRLREEAKKTKRRVANKRIELEIVKHKLSSKEK